MQVPTGYVLVPGGYMHESCVIGVSSGSLLVEEEMPVCPHPFLRSGRPSKDWNLRHGAAWKVRGCQPFSISEGQLHI
jgi:hypothetical protein